MKKVLNWILPILAFVAVISLIVWVEVLSWKLTVFCVNKFGLFFGVENTFLKWLLYFVIQLIIFVIGLVVYSGFSSKEEEKK